MILESNSERIEFCVMARHRAGGKITASHTSIIDAAVPIVAAAEKLPEVSKISLGIIKQVGRGGQQRRVKYLPITGGWKLTVRGSATVQEIFLYTSQATSTREFLETEFP